MPSEGEKLKIRRLVASGRSYKQIAAELPGWTAGQCRKLALREGYVKPQTRADDAAMKRRRGNKARCNRNGEFGIQAAGIKMDYIGAQPKPETLAERERAYDAPRTLTAIMFGDPPPGRSALDKRHA